MRHSQQNSQQDSHSELRSRIFRGTHGRILRVIVAGCIKEFIEKITVRFSQAFAEGFRVDFTEGSKQASEQDSARVSQQDAQHG